MKDVVLTLVLVTLGSTGLGCREADQGEHGDGGDGCGYEEREVSLDAVFGEETPREVIELLERPVDGPTTWFAGKGEYIDVLGAAGETEFHAEVIAGPTVWVREGKDGMGGVQQSRIFCPTQLLFDATVHFETTDGALAEDWSGRATYEVSGTLGGVGSITVAVPDPRPFAGTLTVTEHPNVADEWTVHELAVSLYFITNPLDFIGMHGSMSYDLQNLGNGEGELVTVPVAEFALPPD